MATVAEFLDALPQFGDVEPATIQSWLDDTATVVTDEYGTDALKASIYLAAHNMSLAGIGPNKAASAFIGIKSISSGSLNFTKDEKLGDWGLTPFGRLYFPMMRSARGGGFLVTGTGVMPDEGGPFAWHGNNGNA